MGDRARDYAGGNQAANSSTPPAQTCDSILGSPPIWLFAKP
jgi:hypothetical protein